MRDLKISLHKLDEWPPFCIIQTQTALLKHPSDNEFLAHVCERCSITLACSFLYAVPTNDLNV